MVKDQEALKNKQTSWPIVYKANAILKIMVKKKKRNKASILRVIMSTFHRPFKTQVPTNKRFIISCWIINFNTIVIGLVAHNMKCNSQ